MKSNLDFYHKLCQYRLTASVFYDKGKKSGLSPEELSESIQPIIEALNDLIYKSVRDNLAGVILAIKLLENEVENHKKDSQMLLNKAQDTEQHVVKLKKSIQSCLVEDKITERLAGDYWVTLTGEDITVR